MARLAEHELRHLKNEWWWLAALGILLILSGLVALVYPTMSSIAAVIVLGVSLLVSGVATVVASFWAGKWSAMLLQLLVGVLYVVVGFILMDAPIASTVSLTLFVAALFIVVGIMRSAAALVLRFPQWGWALLSGLLTTLVGVVIYKNLPETALWAIGTLIGIELIFDGWYWVMLGVALWRLPVSRE
jgi:uncharacterized membrane protein HdeD (DUF308 family)